MISESPGIAASAPHFRGEELLLGLRPPPTPRESAFAESALKLVASWHRVQLSAIEQRAEDREIIIRSGSLPISGSDFAFQLAVASGWRVELTANQLRYSSELPDVRLSLVDSPFSKGGERDRGHFHPQFALATALEILSLTAGVAPGVLTIAERAAAHTRVGELLEQSRTIRATVKSDPRGICVELHHELFELDSTEFTPFLLKLQQLQIPGLRCELKLRDQELLWRTRQILSQDDSTSTLLAYSVDRSRREVCIQVDHIDTAALRNYSQELEDRTGFRLIAVPISEMARERMAAASAIIIPDELPLSDQKSLGLAQLQTRLPPAWGLQGVEVVGPFLVLTRAARELPDLYHAHVRDLLHNLGMPVLIESSKSAALPLSPSEMLDLVQHSLPQGCFLRGFKAVDVEGEKPCLSVLALPTAQTRMVEWRNTIGGYLNLSQLDIEVLTATREWGAELARHSRFVAQFLASVADEHGDVRRLKDYGDKVRAFLSPQGLSAGGDTDWESGRSRSNQRDRTGANIEDGVGISVDRRGTRFREDTFLIRERADGGLSVRVDYLDINAFVARGSPADLEARRRQFGLFGYDVGSHKTSLYNADALLATASMDRGQIRPTLSVQLEISKRGILEAVSVKPMRIKNRAALDDVEANNLLESTDHSRESVRQMHLLARVASLNIVPQSRYTHAEGRITRVHEMMNRLFELADFGLTFDQLSRGANIICAPLSPLHRNGEQCELRRNLVPVGWGTSMRASGRRYLANVVAATIGATALPRSTLARAVAEANAALSTLGNDRGVLEQVHNLNRMYAYYGDPYNVSISLNQTRSGPVFATFLPTGSKDDLHQFVLDGDVVVYDMDGATLDGTRLTHGRSAVVQVIGYSLLYKMPLAKLIPL